MSVTAVERVPGGQLPQLGGSERSITPAERVPICQLPQLRGFRYVSYPS